MHRPQSRLPDQISRGQGIFFCSNASIALARSLCKCLLAVLITATEADSEQLQRHVVSGRLMPYHLEKHGQKPSTKNKEQHKQTKTGKKNSKRHTNKETNTQRSRKIRRHCPYNTEVSQIRYVGIVLTMPEHLK